MSLVRTEKNVKVDDRKILGEESAVDVVELKQDDALVLFGVGDDLNQVIFYFQIDEVKFFEVEGNL